jgi:hypothetical protein
MAARGDEAAAPGDVPSDCFAGTLTSHPVNGFSRVGQGQQMCISCPTWAECLGSCINRDFIST